MIKTNELVVGHHYLHNGNWSYRDHSAPKIIQWEERDWYAVGECTMSLDDISGVILTKEIMLSLGFAIKEIYPKNKLHPNGWIVYEKGDISISDDFRWNSIGKGADVKYVHKLQNLYKAFTGEELIFKNNP